MPGKPTTVEKYLAALPPDRRSTLQAVRQVILTNLDSNYEEGIQYGMIGYYVPHRVYPAGYHCDPRQPLPFAGLAAQKNYLSLHLMCLYGNSELTAWFEEQWRRTGRKLDMGKCCVRFKTADDVALDVLGALLRRVPAKKYIAAFEAMRAGRKKPAGTQPARKQAAAKKQPKAVKRPSRRT